MEGGGGTGCFRIAERGGIPDLVDERSDRDYCVEPNAPGSALAEALETDGQNSLRGGTQKSPLRARVLKLGGVHGEAASCPRDRDGVHRDGCSNW